MLRKLALFATFMLVSLPALAGTSCDQPYAPDIKAGVTLTKLELSAMRDDVKTFIDASDLYQACLGKSRNNMSLDAYNNNLSQNQRDKERVGSQVNALIVLYNASLRTNTKVSDASH